MVSFAGPPDAQGFGEFLAPTLPGYHALGYGCANGSANDSWPVSLRGPECSTVFFINQQTRKLVAFFTSSPSYSGPGGIRPGMAAAQAERRTHAHAISGCLDAIWFGIQRTNATLLIPVLGGHDVIHHHRGGPPIGRVLGGRLGPFRLESNRHPVGLSNC